MSFLDSRLAGLFHLFAAVILHDTDGAAGDQEFYLPCKCRYWSLSRVLRPIYSHGTNSPSVIKALSLYPWAQPRLLGTQLLGLGHRA